MGRAGAMGHNRPPLALRLLDALRLRKGLRQTAALFAKNVLVAWRNKWSTALRLLAPMLFLALALLVQQGLQANTRQTGRTRETSFSMPERVSSIPDCSTELFIHDKPCLDFVFTPDNNETVREIISAVMANNNPPIPASRVKGFSSRTEADDFIQSRHQYVLGAVHFRQSPTGQLQYFVQSNTTVVAFKGYVQNPNTFFQVPFMSAVAREVSRVYLQAAGRLQEAATLDWQPRLAAYPHPQLSPGVAGYILPPFVFVACMFSTINLLSMLVSEKESGLRQALRTMGLRHGSYWFSWWLFEAVMAASTAVCITAFGAVLGLPLFRANDPFLLFMLFWLFGMAMTSFACCMSVFMNTTQSAYNGSLVLIVVGWVCQALAAIGLPYAPTLLYSQSGVGKVFFWVFAMLPWNPLTKGILDLAGAAAHAAHPGLRFSERASYCRYIPDPAKSVVTTNMSWLYLDDNCVFSLEQCYWTLLTQAVAWLLAALYLDNVRPDGHGVKLPLWYPLMPRYWANAFRAAAAGDARPLQHDAMASKAAAAGGKAAHKSPFAATDVNRRVAKSLTDRDDKALVIRCSSSAGGAAAEQGHQFTAGVNTAESSAQRHSLTSGHLRRRENRATHSGTDESGAPAAAAADTAARGQAVPRAVQLQASQQQLGLQASLAAMAMSDSSSSGMAAGTLPFEELPFAGNSVSLQQYQQQQQQAKQNMPPVAARRWWEQRRPDAAAEGAAAGKRAGKHVGAGPAGAAGKGRRDIPGALGLVPVVLDAGVLQEEQRMKDFWFSDDAWTSKQDLVQVFGLRKVYKLRAARSRCWWPFGSKRRSSQCQQPPQPQQRQFVAVVDSWFGVPKGQLLCLLGPNGAGKTTTINMMIGALPPSGGDIRVLGHSLLDAGGLEVAQAAMGVCPQFDVLWDELSGSEHMFLYGCIKGLQFTEVAQQASRLLEQVQLTAAAAKRSSSYSGGMKRRLSVALALLGSPQLVFLDEPTTGMDPISRRAVWDAINAAKQRSAVVLTTHSMEEADALGDRIGIMVRGRLRVLGGSLNLKQKYGNGYQLRLRLKDAQAAAVAMQAAPDAAQQEAAAAAAMEAVAADAAGPCQQQQQQQQEQVAAQTSSAAKSLISYFERVLQPADAHGSGDANASPGGSSNYTTDSTSSAAATHGSTPASVTAAGAAGGAPGSSAGGCTSSSYSSTGSYGLQEVVVQHLGLAPVEEGRQMLHYVVPQALAPQLQQLLELLERRELKQQLGLAEVHVSLATLEEVFLAVVKQAEQDYAAAHGHTVVVELPESGAQLEVPVGQEAAADPVTGHVYALTWVQDEWGKLAVLGVRLMEQHEQQCYWQQRHVGGGADS